MTMRRDVRFRPHLSGSAGAPFVLESRLLLSVTERSHAVPAPVHALARPQSPIHVTPDAPAQVSVLAKRPARTIPSRTITNPETLVYIPPGLKASGSYPLLVVFSPTGNAPAAIKQWKAEANRDKWIVLVSRTFSNSVFGGGSGFYPLGGSYAQVIADGYKDPGTIAALKSQIEQGMSGLPVDRSRIILAGFSGGAFVAHDLNATYPGFAAAVIDNSNGEPLIGLDPRTVTGAPTPESFASSRKEAIFLVGQTDTEFGTQIQQTIPVYQAWGWQTLFLTYPAGHKLAPTNIYRQAIKWLLSRPSWK